MGGEIFRTAAYEAAGVVKLLICERGVKARDNYVGVILVAVQHIYSGGAEVFDKLVGAHEVNALAGAVTAQKFNGHITGGHYLVACRRKTKAIELANIKVGGVGGIVGEEKNLFAVCTEIVDKADGKGEYIVSEVYGAVHIKYVEFFCVEYRCIGIFEVHFSKLPFLRILLQYNYITDLTFLQDDDTILSQ